MATRQARENNESRLSENQDEGRMMTSSGSGRTFISGWHTYQSSVSDSSGSSRARFIKPMGASFESIMSVVTTVSAIYMCASPATGMLKIHRNRDVGNASILPLATLWVCNHLWMLYGYVTSNLLPLLATYAIGDALSIVFLAVYVHWATERKAVLKTCAIALLCNAAVTVYVFLVKSGFLDESQESLTLIVGVIAIVSSLALYASPLAAIKIVLQTRSSASLPIAMILAGALNNILWTAYGFLVHDMFVIVPSSVNATLGLVQVALYGLYHPSRFAASDAAGLTPTTESLPCKYSVMGSPTPLPISRVKESIEICSIAIEDPCNNDFVELNTPRGMR